MKSFNRDQNYFYMKVQMKKDCKCLNVNVKYCVKCYFTEGSRLNFFPVCGSCLFFNFSRTSCSASICKTITILDPFPEIIQEDCFFSFLFPMFHYERQGKMRNSPNCSPPVFLWRSPKSDCQVSHHSL